jgi:MFS family permease
MFLELPANTRKAWKWDLATGLFTGLYQGCIWTFVARIARANLHASGVQMGWIAAAPALGYLLSTFWARQMEGRAKLPFVYWTWGVSRGLFLLTPLLGPKDTSLYVFLVCFAPFVFSISTPAYTAVMKEIYPDYRRGSLMSWVRVLLNGVMFIAALLMGHLLDAGLDYRIAFFVGGIFGVLSAWTFSRIPMPPTPDASTERVPILPFVLDTLDILRRNPGFRWFSASVFVYGFGNLMAMTLYPIYQVDRFHVTNTDVARLQNVTVILTIVGSLFWGPFVDRRGPLLAALLTVSLVCTMPICYILAWNLTLLYVAAAIAGIAMSGIDIAYLNTLLLFAEPGRAAQYQALHSSFFGVRGTLAPMVAIPLMHQLGPRGAFFVAFLLMVAGTGLQLISMRDYRRQVAMAQRNTSPGVLPAESD